ncbi:TlpA disulfide reductase family protein [Anaerolineales bacterium HSG6]|nr:TlpA disulfide reductase family protein [Anaerolineales bacterium HSG6]MDM8530638.1 TlpA disulfide reductase family protein [Anaerolineales bacterium HSG25]
MSVELPSEETAVLPFYKTVWFWGILICLVLITGGLWINVSRQMQQSAASDSSNTTFEAAPMAGHPAPDFTLKTLDGESFTLSNFRGKPVLVNFWATWCGPCRAEFPDFQEAAVDNADQLVILGVNSTVNDQPEKVADFIKEFGVTFPIVMDTDGEVSRTYRVMGLPTSIFVDAEGTIIEVFTGPINKAYIEVKLSEL